jgi:hypothetical protein
MANSNGWGDGAGNNAIGWGQGANNNIGWGDSHAKSWAGLTDIVGIDADAQAFITAAAITDPVQINAINTLVEGMKTDGVWTKMKAIYPFVGGTASTHKWNLKDPRDLDAAYRLVFNGGWTHSSNGATPNGTNGYADTYLNTSTNLTASSIHISSYLRTNSDGVFNEIGAYNTNLNASLSLYPRLTNISYNDIGLAQTGRVTYANTDSRGYFIASRTSNVLLKAYKNNTLNGSYTIADNATYGSVKVFLSAQSANNVASQYSNRQTAFATIGDGLTDTEAANLYTRVQAYQTTLSRNV